MSSGAAASEEIPLDHGVAPHGGGPGGPGGSGPGGSGAGGAEALDFGGSGAGGAEALDLLDAFGFAPRAPDTYRPFIGVGFDSMDPVDDADASPPTQLLALAASSEGFGIVDVDQAGAALFNLFGRVRHLLPPTRRAITAENLRGALRMYLRLFCPSSVLPMLVSVHGAAASTLAAVLCMHCPLIDAPRARRSATALSQLGAHAQIFAPDGRRLALAAISPLSPSKVDVSTPYTAMSKTELAAGALGPLRAVLDRATALMQAGASLPLQPLQLVPLRQPAPNAEIRILRMAQCYACSGMFAVADGVMIVPAHDSCAGAEKPANKVLEFIDYNAYI